MRFCQSIPTWNHRISVLVSHGSGVTMSTVCTSLPTWTANRWTNRRRATLEALIEAEEQSGAPCKASPALQGVDPYSVTRTHLQWLAETPELGIPRGYLTRLVGQPDVGKSQLCLYWAALEGRVGGHTLYFAREDGIADMISQRTEAAGVPPGSITVFDYDEDQGVALAGADIEILRATIEAKKATLVILDPVQEYTPERIDGDKQRDVRPVVKRLRSVARSTGTAIVLVQHEGKGERRSKNDVGIGSKDWDAGVRSTLYAGEVGDEVDRYGNPMFVVGNTKLNVNKKASPRKYWIEGRIVGEEADSYNTSCVVMQEEASPDVDMAGVINRTMGGGSSDTGEQSAVDEAMEWLREALADGPIPVSALQAAAKADKLSWRTIERAKGRVGAKAKRGTETDRRAWVWEIARQDTLDDSLAECGGVLDPYKHWLKNSATLRQEKVTECVADLEILAEETQLVENSICTHERKKRVADGFRERWTCLDCGAIRGGGHSRWRPGNEPCHHVNKTPFDGYDDAFKCLDCGALRVGDRERWHSPDLKSEAMVEAELYRAIKARDAAIG